MLLPLSSWVDNPSVLGEHVQYLLKFFVTHYSSPLHSTWPSMSYQLILGLGFFKKGQKRLPMLPSLISLRFEGLRGGSISTHRQRAVVWENLAISQAICQAAPCQRFALLQETKLKWAGTEGDSPSFPPSLLACFLPASLTRHMWQATFLLGQLQLQWFTINNPKDQVLSVNLAHYKSLCCKKIKPGVLIPGCLFLTLRGMLGLNYVLPKSYIEALTPSTSECDCIWK